MSDTNNSRIYGIIVTLLLLLSAGIGWFFWNKSRTMMVENDQKKVMIDSLSNVKIRLERDLDSLHIAYSSLRLENETLAGKVTSTAQQIAKSETDIQKIKTESANNLASLQGQIAGLLAAKTDYESVINTLRTENSNLKNENLTLKTDLSALQGNVSSLKGENLQLTAQVSDLSTKLADQIKQTQSASFRATSFRVEPEKRNDKITAKAKRVREIVVSFDLINVPAANWGQNKLYLVLTDEKGKGLPSTLPLTLVVVQTPLGKKEIEAHAVRPINIEKSQRLTMPYQLSEKLAAGSYVAAVYCDNGLLGATSFRLR